MPYKDTAVRKEYLKKWKKNHKIHLSKWRKKHRLKNLDESRRKEREQRYKYNYHSTVAEIEDLFQKQNGICPICRLPLHREIPRECHVDHCHRTGKLRGWLHKQCNILLGACNEDEQKLLNAIDYLNKTKG